MFEQLAELIFTSYKLIVNAADQSKLINFLKNKNVEHIFRICEIEFYLLDKNIHNDTFTHCDPI